MAYDYRDRYLLLFGGWNGATYLQDTWKFDGNWTPVSASAGPSPRGYSAIAYDNASFDNYIVLFGGRDGSARSLADTWKFAQGSWTYVSVASSIPPGRSDSGMVFDARDGYVLLFGGWDATDGAYFNDTWSFLSGVWTPITTVVAPPERADFSLVFDPNVAANYTVLFGGWNNTPGAIQVFSDTWTFVGGVWTPVRTTHAPAPGGE